MNKLQLEQEQKIIYHIWKNGSENNKLSHSYLLAGNKNAPLLETAKYLAKSLECEDDVFACNECFSCLRFDEDNCPDFMLLDGEKGQIKKEDIINLEQNFSLGELESNHHLVYIIHLVENLRSDAISVLLKFLEEPPTNVTAILTTNNQERVLKTIISRTVLLPVVAPTIRASIALVKDVIDENTAFIVSHYKSNLEEMVLLAQDEKFMAAVNAANEFLTSFANNTNDGVFHLLNDISNALKANSCYTEFYEIVNFFFTSAVKEENLIPATYGNLANAILNLGERALKGITILNEALSLSVYNLNGFLTLSRFAQALIGE